MGPDDAEQQQDDEEGDASLLLHEVGLADRMIVSVEEIATALEIPLSPLAPRGCRGWASTAKIPDKIRFDHRGEWQAAQLNGLHEVGHMAKAWGGARLPHHEPSTGRVALRILLPRAPLRALYGQLGRSVSRVVRAYAAEAERRGHAPIEESLVMKRLGWATNSQIVLAFEAQRPKRIPAHLESEVARLVAIVRSSGEAQNDPDERIRAEPYHDGQQGGVVLKLENPSLP